MVFIRQEQFHFDFSLKDPHPADCSESRRHVSLAPSHVRPGEQNAVEK